MADIKLRNGSGVEQTYTGITKLTVPEATSGTVNFNETTGTLTKTANGTYDCTNYANVTVAIPVYDGSVS